MLSKVLLSFITVVMLFSTVSCNAYNPIPDLKALAKPYKCFIGSTIAKDEWGNEIGKLQYVSVFGFEIFSDGHVVWNDTYRVDVSNPDTPVKVRVLFNDDSIVDMPVVSAKYSERVWKPMYAPYQTERYVMVVAKPPQVIKPPKAIIVVFADGSTKNIQNYIDTKGRNWIVRDSNFIEEVNKKYK